jgi:hypothetical protein
MALHDPRDGIFTVELPAEVGRNKQVEMNFHFSEPPAVTAGLIGFVFDIRK